MDFVFSDGSDSASPLILRYGWCPSQWLMVCASTDNLSPPPESFARIFASVSHWWTRVVDDDDARLMRMLKKTLSGVHQWICARQVCTRSVSCACDKRFALNGTGVVHRARRGPCAGSDALVVSAYPGIQSGCLSNNSHSDSEWSQKSLKHEKQHQHLTPLLLIRIKLVLRSLRPSPLCPPSRHAKSASEFETRSFRETKHY